MNRHRWIQISATLAAAGAAAWLVKFTVIVATDGATTDTGAAAAFYLLGVALMLVGSTWVGARVTARLGAPLFAMGVILSPVVLVASFTVLEGIAKGAVGDAGPAWLEDDAGILATGATWFAASLWARRAATAPRDSSAVTGSTITEAGR